jgi:hypothetical protein
MQNWINPKFTIKYNLQLKCYVLHENGNLISEAQHMATLTFYFRLSLKVVFIISFCLSSTHNTNLGLLSCKWSSNGLFGQAVQLLDRESDNYKVSTYNGQHRKGTHPSPPQINKFFGMGQRVKAYCPCDTLTSLMKYYKTHGHRNRQWVTRFHSPYSIIKKLV